MIIKMPEAVKKSEIDSTYLLSEDCDFPNERADDYGSMAGAGLCTAEVETDVGTAELEAETGFEVADKAEQENEKEVRPVLHRELDTFFSNSVPGLLETSINQVVQKLKDINAKIETEVKHPAMQVLYEDTDFYYFRSKSIAFRLKKTANLSDYRYMGNGFGVTSKGGKSESIPEPVELTELAELAELTEPTTEPIEPIEPTDVSELTDELSEPTTTVVTAEIVTATATATATAELTNVAEPTEPPFDYLEDFKGTINRNLYKNFSYVCDLKVLVNMIKAKKKAVSSWKSCENLIELQTTDETGSDIRVVLSDTSIETAYAFLKNGSVYIQGDKLMVYIESKRGTCYLMPVSMTDAYGAEYSQNSISMVYTCEEIPSTYTVDYLHI